MRKIAPRDGMDSTDQQKTANGACKWTALDGITATVGDVPADAFTQSEYCERYRCDRTTARRRLAVLVAQGKLQQGQGYTTNSAGRRALVTWYRETPNRGGVNG